MRYLSLFSGIGAFEKALERLGIKYELVGFSEIDKYAIKSYCAVHGVSEEKNLGDISKIDLDKIKKLGVIDLITHGSPCQDFSIAGKLAGGDKGSGTRSSLMWCTVDVVEAVCPKYVIWENVKNLLSTKNRHNFDGYLEIMDKLGYNSYYKILNSKHYGIPQNRERVFTVSIRKDIDSGYEFPEETELKLKLKDMLEESVDEKYYLSDKLIAGLIANTERQKANGNGFMFNTTDGDCVAKTVTTRVGACRSGDNYIQVVGELDIKGHDCVKRVYSGEGVAPTLTDMQGGNRQPKVAVAMRGRYDESGVVEQKIEISNREIANSITTVQKDSLIGETSDYFTTQYNKFINKNGYIPEMFNPYNVSEIKDVAPTQSTACGCATSSATVLKIEPAAPHLNIKEATKAGYKEAYAGDGINISGRMKYQRGNVQKGMSQTIMSSGSERGVVVSAINKSAKHQQDLVQDGDSICKCIPAGTHVSTPHLLKTIVSDEPLRIRKLTPRECWRLMGFDDEDFDKAAGVPTSNTQLYKQAGNSIVVNVLEAIFKKLFF